VIQRLLLTRKMNQVMRKCRSLHKFSC
jgi:hypothetical protein